MKFSDYFLAPGVRILSAIIGIPVGIITWIFTDWRFGILVGASVALILSVAVPCLLFWEDRPYNRIKKTLAKPFLFDQRVRFTVSGGTVGGYFILTDQSIIFLSVERGNHRLELSRTDVKSIVLGEDSTISFFLNNTQFVKVISAISEDLFYILRENGWN